MATRIKLVDAFFFVFCVEVMDDSDHIVNVIDVPKNVRMSHETHIDASYEHAISRHIEHEKLLTN